MVFTTEIEIAAFIGAIVGCLVGTLGPYYREKKRLGWDDIAIFFDRKFLQATFVALILAIVGVGGSFPIVLANVPPTASILTTLITSAVLAMAMNLGGNIVIGPSKVTQDAKSLLVERKTVTTMTKALDDRVLKEQELRKTASVTGGPTIYKCDCPTCKDNEEVLGLLKSDDSESETH